MDLNTSSLIELVILMGGPIFQFLSLIVLGLIFPRDMDIIRYYHYGILLFNLLPIYPLDGGKILRILIEEFFYYKRSIKMSIFISYLLVIIIFINNDIKGNMIVMVFLLLTLITKEYKKTNHLYNKFILERYLNTYCFKRTKIVSGIDEFYRNHKHIVKKGNKYYLEADILNKKLKYKKC